MSACPFPAGDPAARHPAERLADSVQRGGHAPFPNQVSYLIQNAVVAGSISQVQTNGQLGLFQNLLPPRCHSAILFHKPVAFELRLERVNPWERIASRRRPAFSSHLRNGIIGSWEINEFHIRCLHCRVAVMLTS